MLGKTITYLAGRGAIRLPGGRLRQKLEPVHRQLGQRKLGDAGVFLSACFGIPPFYAVAVASGALAWSLPRFLIAGACGRLLRFAAVVLAPQGLREVLL